MPDDSTVMHHRKDLLHRLDLVPIAIGFSVAIGLYFTNAYEIYDGPVAFIDHKFLGTTEMLIHLPSATTDHSDQDWL